MQRPVVEVEDEMAVRIPDEAGTKAVATDARAAKVATMRGVREIIAGDSTIRYHASSLFHVWLKIREMCRMTHDDAMMR